MTETLQSKRYNPCKDCPDRYIACSDHCQKSEYLAWKAEQAKIREARRAYCAPIWKHEESVVKPSFRKHRRKK